MGAPGPGPAPPCPHRWTNHPLRSGQCAPTPGPASACFRSRTQARIRPAIHDHRLEDQCCRRGFLPPFGCRHSLLGSSDTRPGLGPPSRSAYRPRTSGAGPGRDYHVPHPRAATGSGASSTPGTAVLTPTGCRARPAPAASQRPVPTPRSNHPPAGPLFTRHQRRFTRFTRPVCPSPVALRVERRTLGLSPCAPHPAVTGDARQGRARPSSTSPELHSRHDHRPPICEFTRWVRPRVATADEHC
jgi:hypothetical protein